MKKILFAPFVLLLSTFISCDSVSVPDGRIMVKNDSQDSDYNILEVSAGGSSFTLKPGAYALMPDGTTTIYFSRQYKDYTRSYTIECPEIKGPGIKIKLIDVHVNRIAGGCKTVQANKG